MPAITQRISDYLGGVSKQSDVNKINGQVDDLINGLPDPTLGLIKRPGFELISSWNNAGNSQIGALSTTTGDFTDAKWFNIQRDDKEIYIGCIKHGSPSTFKIWNALSGRECTVTYGTGTQAQYLTGTKPEHYDIMTVQDTTYIVNKTKVVAPQSALSLTIKKYAKVQLKTLEYSSDYKVTTKVYTSGTSGGTTDATETYHTRNEDTFSNNSDVITKLNASEILTAANGATHGAGLKYQLEQAGFTVTATATTLELSRSDGKSFEISGTGGVSGNGLEFIQDEVSTVANLPSQSKDGRLLKVKNTSAADDDYWVKFTADDGTSGEGNWQEWIDPSVSPGLDADTMPHELVNESLNTFKFQEVSWTDRLVGDDTTNSHPSFVKKNASGTYVGKIQQIFFHGNRLGFLTDENVSMSQAGEYTNLYHTSALTATAADPVDISCSPIKPAVLHGIVPTNQGLVLFSRTQQFLMVGADGVFSPSTTSIKAISSYEVDIDIDPVDAGNKIVFVSKTPGYTRTFAMQTRGFNENPIIVDIGKTVTEWIPDTTDQLIVNSQNELVAMASRSNSDVYLYKTHNDGEKEILQSWFRWKLPGKVQHCAIIEDKFYAVTYHDSTGKQQYLLSVANLYTVSTTEVLETADGDFVNPAIDGWTFPKTISESTTAGTTTAKCYLPCKSIPGLDPILIITSESGVAFNEAGMIWKPTVGSDGTGDFFSVPIKLSDYHTSATDSKVLLGYRYNFDVSIPQVYYKMDQEGRVPDYAASLTISRMKFSMGQSGEAQFKIKPQGFESPSQDFTGVGTTFTLTGGGTQNSTAWASSGSSQTAGVVKNCATVNNTDGTATGLTLDVNVLSTGVVDLVTTIPKANKEGTGYESGDVIKVAKETLGINADLLIKVNVVGQTEFKYSRDFKDVDNVQVKVNGIKQSSAKGEYTVVESTDTGTADKGTVTLTKPAGQDIAVQIYSDTAQYDLAPIKEGDYYLADDIPLKTSSVYTVPIHQRSNHFTVRVFSNSPLPLSLNSMMWEGIYSPRFYRRA